MKIVLFSLVLISSVSLNATAAKSVHQIWAFMDAGMWVTLQESRSLHADLRTECEERYNGILDEASVVGGNEGALGRGNFPKGFYLLGKCIETR